MPEMHASYPDWQPTSDVIAFQAGPDNWWDAIETSGSNLFTISADGSDLKRLTDFGQSEPAVWLPAWSADGQSILVTQTIRATRDNSLGALGIDGSGFRVLPGPILGAHLRQERLPQP